MSQSTKPKVLFVLTSTSKIPNTDKPTGWYLPEFAHPYKVLAPHCEVVVASPEGGEAPLDPNSVEAFKEDESSTEFLKNSESLWKNTSKLSDLIGRAEEFDAVFYVGGHGPMFDLATSSTSQSLIREFASHRCIISGVCHGPAAFVNVLLPNDKHLLDSTPVTGFSNSEEDSVGFTQHMPFSLQDALDKNSNGKFGKAKEDFGEYVVESGSVITGQNPASAKKTGEAVLRKIEALRAESKA